MSQTATTRLLAALELLQTRRLVTGAELAGRLEVDRRTVRRYIARLIEMGVPIESERGRDGAYRMTAGYKLPPMMFSDEEALALAMGLVAARELGLGQTRLAVDSALAKLERVMPEGLRTRLRAADRAVRLDLRAPGASASSRASPALGALSEAVQKQQRLRIRYQAAGPGAEVSERLFDAWGLAHYLGRWYAVGWCHLRGGRRSFRLDRMLAAEPVPASFAPPPGFDALAAMREAIATLPRRHAVEVVLHATLEEARHRLRAEVGTLEPLADDRVRLRAQADELDWFARELAALPFRFEIVEPPELAEALHAHAQRLLADSAWQKR